MKGAAYLSKFRVNGNDGRLFEYVNSLEQLFGAINPGACKFLQGFTWWGGDTKIAEQHWWCGPVSSLQEPCFIPRHKRASEGDGWIVQIRNRLDEHSSELLLFEALDIAKGPIATIQIPIRMRFGLHGNWAEAADIGLAA